MGTNGRMITGILRDLARPFVNCSLSLPRNVIHKISMASPKE